MTQSIFFLILVHRNDIALLKLEKRTTIRDEVQLACLMLLSPTTSPATSQGGVVSTVRPTAIVKCGTSLLNSKYSVIMHSIWLVLWSLAPCYTTAGGGSQRLQLKWLVGWFSKDNNGLCRRWKQVSMPCEKQQQNFVIFLQNKLFSVCVTVQGDSGGQ